MKKEEKRRLAEKILLEIKKLNISVKVNGHWIELSPPDKIPLSMTMDIMKCSDELIKIL
jgi:hypothetical protein